MVKDTDNIYYSTKNEVRGLCVGGDMVILFFCHFTEFGENGPHPNRTCNKGGVGVYIFTIFVQKILNNFLLVARSKTPTIFSRKCNKDFFSRWNIDNVAGILQTALIVGVLSETLVIPPDEKRILASVDRQSKYLLINTKISYKFYYINFIFPLCVFTTRFCF